MTKKVVAVVSGGADSTSYMAHYKKALGYEVDAITFNYGQKAQAELKALQLICDQLEINLKVIHMNLSSFKSV